MHMNGLYYHQARLNEVFRLLSSGEIFYEGGEAKGSDKGTQTCFELTTLIVC